MNYINVKLYRKLTIWNRVIEKLIVAQVAYKLFIFMGPESSFRVHKSSPGPHLCAVNQSTPSTPPPLNVHFNVILSPPSLKPCKWNVFFGGIE